MWREHRNRQRQERRAADPEYSEQIKREGAARRERYANDLEFRARLAKRDRDYRRRRYATDPAFREMIRLRIRKYEAANREQVNQYYRMKNQIRRARQSSVLTIPFTLDQWLAKAQYWGDRCWVCGGPWSAIDHVKPIAANGGHVLCNLRPICTPCNSSKHDKWPVVNPLGVHGRNNLAA